MRESVNLGEPVTNEEAERGLDHTKCVADPGAEFLVGLVERHDVQEASPGDERIQTDLESRIVEAGRWNNRKFAVKVSIGRDSVVAVALGYIGSIGAVSAVHTAFT